MLIGHEDRFAAASFWRAALGSQLIDALAHRDCPLPSAGILLQQCLDRLSLRFFTGPGNN